MISKKTEKGRHRKTIKNNDKKITKSKRVSNKRHDRGGKTTKTRTDRTKGDKSKKLNVNDTLVR
jgi:hypothetical protein